MQLWTEIRRRVLAGELSLRQACAEYGLNFRTVRKIVRAPELTSSENSSAASASAEARIPSCSSSSGGFHIATRRAAFGAASRSTSRKSSRPVSRSASSTGLAIVALVSRNRGAVP